MSSQDEQIKASESRDIQVKLPSESGGLLTTDKNTALDAFEKAKSRIEQEDKAKLQNTK